MTRLVQRGCFGLLQAGARHAQIPFVCACACPSWPGREAGLPGAFWCASPFPLAAPSYCSARPLRAGVAPCLVLCSPSPCFPSPPPPPFFFPARPLCLLLTLVSGPGCLGPWRCVLFVLLASCFSALCALSPCLCFPPRHWLLPGGCCPPPPSFLSRGFPCCRSVLLSFFSLSFVAARDTAHAHAPRATEGQGATNHTPKVGRTGATQPTRWASGRSGTPRPPVESRPGCMGDHGKHQREP